MNPMEVLTDEGSCIKIVGEQKTDDWDRPRLDRIAWRRLDTVWLAPGLGVAAKVERIIEKREPGRSTSLGRLELPLAGDHGRLHRQAVIEHQ